MESKKIYMHAAGVCTALFVCCVIPVPAYAGSINAHEAGVIAAADQTFTYNGQEYRASPGYVSQLRSYLAGDGVDLTAAEAQTLISDIHANVAAGVEQGYLEPVGGTPADDGTADGTVPEDQEKGTSGNGAAQADAEKGKPADGTAQADADQKASGDGPADGQDTSRQAGGQQDVSDGAAGVGASWDGVQFTDAARDGKEECKIKETPNQTVVYDSDGNKVFQSEAVMKNTGYRRSTRMQMLFAAVFGGFLSAGIWMAIGNRRLCIGRLLIRRQGKGGRHET